MTTSFGVDRTIRTIADIKGVFEPLGYEVEAVHDGAVGLARAREETYGIAADLLSFGGGAAAGE